MIWASRGSVSLVQVEPVPHRVPGDWRVFFDLAVDDREPVDLRVFLRQGSQTLTETWLYLFEPVPVS
jgi:glucans biosynthesis protein